MARNVFDNAQLAHVWYSGNQASGRSHNGNFSFDGAALYSYATVIATRHIGADGKAYALVNPRKYSMTTASKHFPAMWRALSYRAGFVVPDYGTRPDHVANLAHLCAAYRDLRDKLLKRLPSYGNPRDHLTRLHDIADDYARAFGVNFPHPADIDADVSAIEAAEAARNAPEVVAKRDKARAARERRECIVKVREALSVIANARNGRFVPWREQQKANENLERFIAPAFERYPEEARAALDIVRTRLLEREIDATFNALNPLAGEVVNAQGLAAYQRRAMSRITPDDWMAGKGEAVCFWTHDTGTLVRRKGERVETSRGAEVPFKSAVMLYRMASEVARRGEPVDVRRAAPEATRIGHFELTRIEANGDCVVGCHYLKFTEMERLAAREVPHLVKARYPLPMVASNQGEAR